MNNQKKKFLNIAMVTFLSCSSSFAMEEDDGNSNFNFGVNCFKAEKYDDAWRYFSLAAKEGFALSETYLGAISLFIYEKRNKAKKHFKIAGNMKEPNALYFLAEIYHDEGDIDLAKKFYVEAINLGHENAENRLGIIFLNEKNLEKAEEYFKSCASKGNLYAYCNLGYVYKSLGKIEEAIKTYQIPADEDDILAQFCLGQIYLELGKRVEAEKCFVYLALCGDHIDSSYYAGLIRYDRGDLFKAKIFLTKAASFGHEKAQDTLKQMGLDS